MDYIIRKKDIFIADLIVYDNIIGDNLCIRDIYEERRVVKVNDMFIDLESGQEVFMLDIHNGVIVGEVFANTLYIAEAYEGYKARDEELKYACDLYEAHLKLKNILNESDNIIKFPQRRII